MTAKTNIINRLLPSMEERIYFLLVLVITLAITTVNATTALVDAERSGVSIDSRTPWLYEASSAVILLSLYPLIMLAVRRMPVTAENWKTHLPLYLGFSVLFSAAHVAGMVAIRKVAYWLYFDGPYVFFGDVWRESLYEYRKDLVSFLMITSLAHVVMAKVKDRDNSQGHKRLQLKSGSQTIFVDAGDFLYAKAAGNYVDLTLTDGETHLIRMSLSALHDSLSREGIAAVRIHRSYIVRAEKVREVTPKGDGDAELMLTDGTPLPVSRRYRAQLAEALS